MARRPKSSPAEDLMKLVAKLPWWLGAALAVLSYVVLHRIAVQPVATAGQADQIVAAMQQSLWTTLAGIGQYLVPFICLVGAGLSAWNQRQRKGLLTQVAASPSAQSLNGMTWQEFEQLVGEAFRQQGYAVQERGGPGPDGGIDLALTKGGDRYLVQCKQWRAFKVGVDVLRELYGVMAAEGAAGGFVVTSGRFTPEALAFASGRNISTIDGDALHRMIRKPSAESLVNATSPTPATRMPASTDASVPPTCPLCTQPMTQRLAKRGSNAGASFWGCTAYPVCKGTRSGG